MRKAIAIIGILIGVSLVIVGFIIKVPDREISYYGIKEYVGGDAYNFQIEASILGGEIAGATMSKAIYCVGGCIVLTISCLALSLKDSVSIPVVSTSIESKESQDI